MTGVIPGTTVPEENQRFIGIQILGPAGGTPSSLRGILVSADSQTRGEVPRPVTLGDTSPTAVRGAILNLVGQLKLNLGPSDAVVGVGVEIGGIIVDGKLVKRAPAFGPAWDNQRIVQDLEPGITKELGYSPRLVAINDANALAVHERRFAKDPFSDMEYFAVVLLTDEGVGCGLILGDSLYSGSKGSAGELGHVRVPDSDVKCACDRHGCLQTMATASAIRRAENAKADLEVTRRAAGRALGSGLSALINLVNPEGILIYGQESTTGPADRFSLGGAARLHENPYLQAMAVEVLEHTPGEAASGLPVVVRTELPGAKAAAAVAIDAHIRYRVR